MWPVCTWPPPLPPHCNLGHNWLAVLLQGLEEEVDHVGNDGLHGVNPHAQIDLVEWTIWALQERSSLSKNIHGIE
jgi:hypothetical protein